MPIPVTTNFEINAPRPIDDKNRKETLVERDAIPIEFRFTGLECFVEETKRRYSLINGVENTDWEETSSTGNVRTVEDISSDFSFSAAVPGGSLLLSIVFLLTQSEPLLNPKIDVGTTPGGTQIAENYELYPEDEGANILSYTKYFSTDQTLYFSGDFNGATMTIHVIHQRLNQ